MAQMLPAAASPTRQPAQHSRAVTDAPPFATSCPRHPQPTDQQRCQTIACGFDPVPQQHRRVGECIGGGGGSGGSGAKQSSCGAAGAHRLLLLLLKILGANPLWEGAKAKHRFSDLLLGEPPFQADGRRTRPACVR